MIMIIILTRTNNHFRVEFWKHLISYLTKRNRGPRAVANSVTSGFKENNIEYKLNPSSIPMGSTVLVLSGVQALRDAIKLKKDGFIQKLIAGPNIVENPVNESEIIKSKYIDKIIVPSGWVRDLYSKYLNEEELSKVHIWAAGVSLGSKSKPRKSTGRVLVYKKKCPESLYKHVQKTLSSKNILYDVIEYGSYKRRIYLSKLKKVDLLIYLQETESQGIALFESWSTNTPTLVWEKKEHYINKYNVTIKGKISAPYLSEENGLSFNGIDDFDDKFKFIIENLNSFEPYEFINKYYTNDIASRNLLDIIKK